jgi:hypothetical protein
MASPKDGSEIPTDDPKAPAAPVEAMSTDPGEAAKIKERNRTIEQETTDSTTVDPGAPPASGSGEELKLSWISVELQDTDGKPVVAEPFYIIFSDNSRAGGVTGPDGKCKLEGVPAGSVKIDFERIDKREWKPK